MAKICVTEKTVQRQRWIENGLLELMLRKKYGEISVTDLCEHLPLSRRSFYRYFNDLDDVLNSLIDHTFQNLALAPLNPTIDDLEKSYQFWVEHKDILDALNNGNMLEKLFDFTLRYTNFRGIDPGKSGLHRDRQLFIIGGFLSLIISWYMEGFQKSPLQMAQTAHKMLYEPFLKTE